MMGNYRYHLVAGLLVLLDQITKLAVKGFSIFGFTHEGMKPGEVVPVIGDTVRFTFVENAGSAFGLEWGEAKIVLTLATTAIAAGLFWYLHNQRESPKLFRLALMLLLAGAVGNLIDRTFYGVAYNESALFLGSVVDFIQVDIPNVTVFGQYWTHWPVFNVADSCVSVGIVLLLFTSGKVTQKTSPPTSTGLPSSITPPTDTIVLTDGLENDIKSPSHADSKDATDEPA